MTPPTSSGALIAARDAAEGGSAHDAPYLSTRARAVPDNPANVQEGALTAPPPVEDELPLGEKVADSISDVHGDESKQQIALLQEQVALLTKMMGEMSSVQQRTTTTEQSNQLLMSTLQNQNCMLMEIKAEMEQSATGPRSTKVGEPVDDMQADASVLYGSGQEELKPYRDGDAGSAAPLDPPNTILRMVAAPSGHDGATSAAMAEMKEDKNPPVPEKSSVTWSATAGDLGRNQGGTAVLQNPSSSRGQSNRRRESSDKDPDDDGSEDSSDDDLSGGRGARSRSKKTSRRTVSWSDDDSEDGYESRREARRIVKAEFGTDKISQYGDVNFELQWSTWDRMTTEYRIRELHLVQFMKQLFAGDVLRVYENVRREYPEASSRRIWKKMAKVVYNDAHKSTAQEQLYNPKYDPKKETIVAYSTRLKSTSMALDQPMSNKQLIKQFARGLPHYLNKTVVTMRGDYDDIVARTIQFDALAKPSESFRAIDEAGAAPGYLVTDGRRVKHRPGVLCYRRNCNVNGGKDHFNRDHRATESQNEAQQGSSGNGSGASTGTAGSAAPQQ